MITLITPSASRFNFFQISLFSLIKNLHYKSDMKKVLHEDVRDQRESEQLVKFAGTLYDEVKVTNPALGHSNAVNYLLEQVTTDYALYWEEDWELLQPIDLNLILDLMERNKDSINQIAFSKRPILPEQSLFIKKEVRIDSYILTTKNHWSFLPSIWRMSYVKNFLSTPLVGDPAWDLNTRIKGTGVHRDADWNIENMKVFYFGHIGSGYIVKDLAKGNSLRKGEYKWQ